METLRRDVSHALRVLSRSPGFALVAVLSVGLGIGAATAVFSFANAVLLRPFPYYDAERVGLLWASRTEKVTRGISGPDLYDLRKQNHVFEDVEPVFGSPGILFTMSAEQALSTKGLYVGTGTFSLLGVHPYLGRTFIPADGEAGGQKVVVLSYSLWQGTFGSDRSIVQRSILLDGEPYAVVGVMPHDFFFPDPNIQLWMPLPPSPILEQRGAPTLHAIARLRSGYTFDQAQSELDTIARGLSHAFPDTDKDLILGVFPLLDQVVGKYRAAFWSLLFGVGLLLLIACANIAHLLLARGLRRRGEIAIRIAFGATHAAIARQLLTESVILGLGSGVAGVLFASAAMRLLLRFGLTDIPRFNQAGLDASALTFALGVSMSTGLLFGLFPAIRASRLNAAESLKQAGIAYSYGARSHLRDLLMISEIALAFVLAVSAGLLINSFVRLMRVDWGFKAENLIVVNAEFPKQLRGVPQLEADVTEQILSRLASLPGVKSVGVGTGIPLRCSWIMQQVSAGAAPQIWAGMWLVGPAYFQTLGVPLLEGRETADYDNAFATRVVVVSRELAERLWPGQDPIGKKIDFKAMRRESWEALRESPGTFNRQIFEDPNSWTEIPYEVVGVVGHIRMFGLKNAEEHPPLYVDFRQRPDNLGLSNQWFLLRTSVDPLAITRTASEQIRTIGHGITTRESATMNELLSQEIGGRGSNRLLLLISSATSTLGLLIATIGIYSVVAHATTMRTHEIGIRMALGAQPTDILSMVVSRGAALTIVGLLFGLAAAITTTRWLASYIYGVTPTDPATITLVFAFFLAVALLACWFAARIATSLDPLSAIRYE